MPPVTDPKGIMSEKNIKDFSRQYLKEGMWPGKINNSLTERNNPQLKKAGL